jgi:hypothetical protein
MKLKIEKIVDRGSRNDERLWLKVLQDSDLSYYIVFDTTYTSQNAISNILRHSYWFPSIKVKSGDNVVLYTQKGKYLATKNNDGTTTHFFYWGSDNPIWNNQGDCAVLFEITTWVTSLYE